jgi:glucosamine-6-phosphate deaminase
MDLQRTITESEQLEKIKTFLYPDAEKASVEIARQIASLIRVKQEEGRMAVLGLATGSSPIRVYAELCRLHKEEGLSFENVVTFNLDEYYPIKPEALQSYVRFMNEHLFDHIDIKKENIHIPDGTSERDEVFSYCRDYEEKIRANGGLDIQILGIGRTGHIGFNEPGSVKESRTRMITLDRLTRSDAAEDFFGDANVPRRAITMGVGTILEARKIIIMAWGDAKAPIVQKAVEGDVSEAVTASFLQEHANASFYLDTAASAELTRFRRPWLVGSCEWDDRLIRRAVVWLSHTIKKPLLKLLDEDYTENGLGDLVTEHGPGYTLNIRIFNELQHTISGWPGGKPEADDSNRPERAQPFPKRVLVFSPEPASEVNGMGGTLRRLVEQGNEVHVVYMTSGNKMVSDGEATRFVQFLQGVNEAVGNDQDETNSFGGRALAALQEKRSRDVDSEEVLKIKALIREGESRASCQMCGLDLDRIRFLNLPFYETGRTRNLPLSEGDFKAIASVVSDIRPHQIFTAGDLQNPGSTRWMCFDGIMTALKSVSGEAWLKECRIWLYRGGWEEQEIDEIDMAVPVSPGELSRKAEAVYQHQSQKSSTASSSQVAKEFWSRSVEQNRHVAKKYDNLGLAEYEGIECFRLWRNPIVSE